MAAERSWCYVWEAESPELLSLKRQCGKEAAQLRMDIIEFDRRTTEGRWGFGDIEWHRGRLAPNVLVTQGWFGDGWTIDRVDQQRRMFGLGDPPQVALRRTT